MTDRFEKKDKIALVTGGGRGLGYAFATRLAIEGATVIIADMQADDGLVNELMKLGAESAEFYRINLKNSGEIKPLCDHLVEKYGRVDIIVNNAGISGPKPFFEVDEEYLKGIIAVNVEAIFLICQLLAPSMMDHKYGRIVNISSSSLGLMIPDGVAYIMTKGAVVGLTRALATEFGQHGITVNCIAPGLIRTPATEGDRPDEQAFMGFAQGQAIKRPGMPEDLAGALSFLTSDDSAYITGQTMIVDGGQLRSL